VSGARTLAQVYRRFGEVDAAGSLYERVAVAVSESEEALRAVEAAPARRRHPSVILAALHDLALAGRAPALAAAYTTADGDAAARAAVDTLLRMPDEVAAVAARRRPWTDEPGRLAVLYPAVAEAARRTDADAVGLVDVGCGAGLNLDVARSGITYSTGQVLGDPRSPAQLSCTVVGDAPVPALAIPDVAARLGIDPDPLVVTDPEQARWMRACVWPDRLEDAATLDARIAVAASDPPSLLRGDVLERLPEALDRVPVDALPVVTTTWALSRLSLDDRLRFLQRLDDAAAHRPVAWVSVEGVGVAPSVATFGDRPASGHSIIGVAVLDGSSLHTEAVGRCWRRGRMLSWLADS